MHWKREQRQKAWKIIANCVITWSQSQLHKSQVWTLRRKRERWKACVSPTKYTKMIGLVSRPKPRSSWDRHGDRFGQIPNVSLGIRDETFVRSDVVETFISRPIEATTQVRQDIGLQDRGEARRGKAMRGETSKFRDRGARRDIWTRDQGKVRHFKNVTRDCLEVISLEDFFILYCIIILLLWLSIENTEF